MDLTEQITFSNQHDSPLLRLPAELRTNIYEHTFRDAHLVLKPKSTTHQTFPTSLALLFTCRQIQHEASVLSYTLLTLDLTITLPSESHLHALESRLFRYITTIEISWGLVGVMMGGGGDDWELSESWQLVGLYLRDVIRGPQALKRVYVSCQHGGWKEVAEEGHTLRTVAQRVRKVFERQDLEVICV